LVNRSGDEIEGDMLHCAGSYVADCWNQNYTLIEVNNLALILSIFSLFGIDLRIHFFPNNINGKG